MLAAPHADVLNPISKMPNIIAPCKLEQYKKGQIHAEPELVAEAEYLKATLMIISQITMGYPDLDFSTIYNRIGERRTLVQKTMQGY